MFRQGCFCCTMVARRHLRVAPMLGKLVKLGVQLAISRFYKWHGQFFGPYCWRKIGSHDVCAVRLAMSTQTETSGEPCTAIRARVPRGHVPNYSRSLSEYCIGPGFRLLLVLLSRHIISLIRLARLIRQPSKGQVNLPCISMHRPCFHQIRAVCLIDVFLRLAILGHPPFGQTHFEPSTPAYPLHSCP